jgi:hypothetical protein
MSKSEEKNGVKEDPGVGLDCGTMNFVSARRAGKQIKTTRIRDAFLDLPAEHKRMLKIANTSYVELDGRLLVIGDEALQTANLFNREARRPMSGGVITPGEIDAQQVIGLMLRQILGAPRQDFEKCCFSVPAPAVDVTGSDVTYHSAILKKILEELGYEAEPANEAQAIVYSECSKENFSGLGISYGSGMTNVSLSYNALSALEFSVGRGGDWVDVGAARAVSTTAAKMCSLKESGIDISQKQETREGEAIALYLENLIDYSIKTIIQQFSKARSEILVPKPIPLIVSGGTSLATGFLDKFKERFQIHRPKFPVEISEVRAATDPMTAVATGLLLLSQMEG